MFTMKAPAKKSGFFTASIADGDAEVADAIGKELGRQQHEIELIASENIVSQAVLEAAGTVLTNKYAEGYPGKRYYGGCQYRRRWPSSSPSSAPRSCSAAASPTCSRTRAARPTRPCSWR